MPIAADMPARRTSPLESRTTLAGLLSSSSSAQSTLSSQSHESAHTSEPFAIAELVLLLQESELAMHAAFAIVMQSYQAMRQERAYSVFEEHFNTALAAAKQ